MHKENVFATCVVDAMYSDITNAVVAQRPSHTNGDNKPGLCGCAERLNTAQHRIGGQDNSPTAGGAGSRTHTGNDTKPCWRLEQQGQLQKEMLGPKKRDQTMHREMAGTKRRPVGADCDTSEMCSDWLELRLGV